MGDEDIRCQCGAAIGKSNQFCFYREANGSVHFTVKPELLAVILPRGIMTEVDTGKKPNNFVISKIVCCACRNGLGTKMRFRGFNSVGFPHDKIQICGKIYRKKWKDIAGSLAAVGIELRDDADNNGHQKRLPAQLDVHDVCPIEFYERSNTNKLLSGSRVCSGKIPRPYQLEAFVMAVGHNCVIVMPTGTGKTLVAALAMRSMYILNPSRVTVMVVDRIPLVYQQKTAIELDTGMRVVGLCGENKTGKMVSDINEGRYNAVVITAGAFLELIAVGRFDPSTLCSMVVFDECHHATGGHVYAQLLAKLNAIPSRNRPRIVGLSASPVQGDKPDVVLARLGVLQDTFGGGTRVFAPHIAVNPPEVEYVEVNECPSQRLLLSLLRGQLTQTLEALIRLIKELNLVGCVGAPLLECVPTSRWGELRAAARDVQWAVRAHSCGGGGDGGGGGGGSVGDRTPKQQLSTARRYAAWVLALVCAAELSDSVGCQAAIRRLKQGQQQGDSQEGWGVDCRITEQLIRRSEVDPTAMSPRYHTLIRLLTSAAPAPGPTSASTSANSGSRALVFVPTRQVAAELTAQLQCDFPHLGVGKVVGQGGVDGMGWEEQQGVIEQMRDGRCRVIVSTEVLEEGLDVPTCNLAVRFAGSPSLIQHVQSRGRARSAQGRLVVILSYAELDRARRTAGAERVVNAVLATNFSELSSEASLFLVELDSLERGEEGEQQQQPEATHGVADAGVSGCRISRRRHRMASAAAADPTRTRLGATPVSLELLVLGGGGPSRSSSSSRRHQEKGVGWGGEEEELDGMEEELREAVEGSFHGGRVERATWIEGGGGAGGGGSFVRP